MSTLNEVDALVRDGFTVRARSASELDLTRGTEQVRAKLVRQKTGLTHQQIAQAQEAPQGEVVLFVVPRATARVRELVANEPQAWLIAHDGTVILGDEAVDVPREKRAARGRIPWGRYALMRALARTTSPRSQIQLAAEVGLTQGAVSGALAKLTAATRSEAGWSATDPGELWDAFLSEYPGAGGVRTHWYSREPFVRQCDLLRQCTLLSADAGSDIIAPWRTPVRAVAYTSTPVDLEELGFSPATADEATVDLVMPADQTIFETAKAWGAPGVADPLLIAWDLRDIGGNDVEEAIAHLRSKALGIRS
jgi:hypothetical protein